MNKNRAESGFTLIEVLVASAILVVSIGVLMQLFASGLDRMHRSGVVSHRILVERQIVSELRTINPAETISGKGSVEGQSYRWQAKAVSEFQLIHVSMEPSGTSGALFNIHVELMRNGKPERAFELTLLGWK